MIVYIKLIIMNFKISPFSFPPNSKLQFQVMNESRFKQMHSCQDCKRFTNASDVMSSSEEQKVDKYLSQKMFGH